MAAKELEQPEQRRYATFQDEHGRTWGTDIDIRTGHSCGQWEPRFQAPWIPEAKYIRHDLKNSHRIIIDYDKNIRDLKDAHSEFDDLRFRAAQQEWGSAAGSKMGKTYEEDAPELTRMVGKPPRPVQFPEAAKEGNKWVLGFSNLIPTWAYPLLEAETRVEKKYLDAEEEDLEKRLDLEEKHDPKATGGKKQPVGARGHSEYTAFVKAHKGKPLTEISKLWKAHKAAAAAA